MALLPVNARIWLIGVLLVLSMVTATSSTRAFHEDIPACPEGATGYLATLIAEKGMVYNFLSSEDPPSAKTILCQIGPQVLVQVKTNSKEM